MSKINNPFGRNISVFFKDKIRLKHPLPGCGLIMDEIVGKSGVSTGNIVGGCSRLVVDVTIKCSCYLGLGRF